jgi:hypothetical protein
VPNEDPKECKKNANQGRGVFQKNSKHRWVFAPDDFIPGAFIRIFSGKQLLIRLCP